jgi:hypothetical protein
MGVVCVSSDELIEVVNRSAHEGLVLEDLVIIMRYRLSDKAKHAFLHKSFPLFQTRQNGDSPLKAFLYLRRGKFPGGRIMSEELKLTVIYTHTTTVYGMPSITYQKYYKTVDCSSGGNEVLIDTKIIRGVAYG